MRHAVNIEIDLGRRSFHFLNFHRSCTMQDLVNRLKSAQDLTQQLLVRL